MVRIHSFTQMSGCIDFYFPFVWSFICGVWWFHIGFEKGIVSMHQTLCKSGKVQQLAMILQVFRGNTMNFIWAFEWYIHFKASWICVDDTKLSGRPISSTMPIIIDKIHQLVCDFEPSMLLLIRLELIYGCANWFQPPNWACFVLLPNVCRRSWQLKEACWHRKDFYRLCLMMQPSCPLLS